MGSVSHLPSGDYRNDGWTIVGSGINQCWQAWSSTDDTKYCKCPSSKGYCAVVCPIDITTVPEGAVITSITISIRTSTGAGTPPTGTPATVTVNVACKDDTSRYTSRTVACSGTPTTVEVGKYKTDPLGRPWDIETLNHLILRCFSYCGVFDAVRCHRLYCTVNYRVRPTITVDAPSGTVLTPSPVISWTYTQTDGDPQKHAEYKLFTSVQQSAISFNPDTAQPVYYGTVTGDISSVTLPTSINPDSYWVYVRSYSTFEAKSKWVGRQFSVSGPSPGVPGVPDPTGTALPGTGIIAVVPDSEEGSATLTLRDTSNLMSIQEADAETSVDGLTPSATNATVTRDTVNFFPGGSASWKMSSTASGNMSATSTWIEIQDSTPVTARAQFFAVASARSCNVSVDFYDGSYSSLGSTITSTNITDSTSTWTEAVVSGNSPAGTAYARVSCNVLSTGGAAEVHNFDRIGLMYGTATSWSDGGHMGRNLLSSWYSTSEGTAPSGQAWTPATATTVGTTTPPGTGGSGAACTTLTYVGLMPTIGFRAAGTMFTSPTSGTDFTLNKPAGTALGDLLVAFVTSSEDGTITPPAGWTLVDSARVDDGTTDAALHVLMRTATGSEPSTWTDGSLSVASLRRAASVVAYSGAAATTDQFIGEGVSSTGNATPTFLTTPTVNNTDPNAWRLSAFAFNDNAASGTQVSNVLAPSVIPAIAYVGRAAVWTDTSNGGTFTINKPTGVVSGDLMIAAVAGSFSSSTVSTPSGWTKIDSQSGSNGPNTQVIFIRTAGGSEPASWSGTITGGTIRYTRTVECVAYRNAAIATSQFLAASGTVKNTGGSTMTTNSVTNTDSRAWRICIFSGDASSSASWSGGDTTERADDTTVNTTHDYATTVAVSDSNGPVSTGSYSKSATLSRSFYTGAAWIGFIKPLASAPAPGGNETQRATTNVGSSNPWLSLGVYDSNGVVAAGSTSVTGSFTPGSGSDINSAAGWIGIIRPASAVRNGYAAANMATTVDISSVDSSIMSLAQGQMTVSAAFIGSTAGTAYLTANFYRANVLLNSSIAQGSDFDAATWSKSSATFAIPDGTTRVNMGVSVPDRNVSDVVYFDRAGVSLGTDDVWRPGTSRDQHPLWALPLIQYADDDGSGYGEWSDLPGTVSNPPSYDPFTGYTQYIDHTVVPLTNRKYRVRTVSYGLLGDKFVSDWGPESSEFSFTAENWWLKDISDPSQNIQLFVKYDTVNVATTNTAVLFQPIGQPLPVVLTEGYKGDQFDLVMRPFDHARWAQLKKMLKSGRTLFLQSDIDHAWWVRPVGDLTVDILPTSQRKSNPIREIKVTFVQVDPQQ